MDTLAVGTNIRIPMSEIEIKAVRAQGPGGQNTNKVATAIHLRFASQECAALPDFVKQRLLAMRDRRVTADGVIVIKSQASRSQARNREAALTRLAELIGIAGRRPKARVTTAPSRRQREKRLADKRHRADIKRSRSRVDYD